MHRLLSLVSIIVVVFFVGSVPAAAQQSEAAAIYKRYGEVFAAGDYAAALIEAQKYEAAVKAQWGVNHTNYAAALGNIANVYFKQGRYAEAEGLHKRALAINEQARGAGPPYAAIALVNLATIYETQGKYAEAEGLFKRSLAIFERALGASHPRVATTLNNLALVYEHQDRFADAEGLYKRALAIREQALGASHPDVALPLNNLASVYRVQGKYAEAEALNKRALAIREQALGASHPNVAQTLHNLASVYRLQGKYAEAEALNKRALAIREQALGASHPELAHSLLGLANVYRSQGKRTDAEALLSRALAIYEQAFGASHPEVATSLNNLASLYGETGNVENALAFSRKATAAVIAHAAAVVPDVEQQGSSAGLVEQRAEYFKLHVANLAMARRKGVEPAPVLGREALEIAQWAGQSSAAAALQQMGARFAGGIGALGALIRDSQDLTSFLRERNKALIEALAKPEGQRSGSLIETTRRQIAETESKLAAANARLQNEFPEYAALASPKPLKAEEVQYLLGADEALVFWLAGDKESHVFALTREGSEWKTIAFGAEDLSKKVAAFRRGLDVDEFEKSGGAKSGLFNLGGAHELYRALLAPVDARINNKRQLLVVPSGALTALPFHLLVTEKPEAPVPEKLDGYRDAAWLARRHAITVLPSVASLKALRVFAGKDHAPKPMIGFGDPVFGREAPAGGQRSTKVAARTRAYTEFWQGAGVDRRKLSQALPRLEDTADEVKAVAQKLGAPSRDILLRAAATETAVKRAALADYRVVYFATHGLVAGDVKGLAEPSLALSIPARPTNDDDGLLTASEIAQLKLNADWVVLSACNTIAGDKPGAEALSGLARAFFYAGARALLVSHWAVESNAATRLTTSTFDLLKSDPKLSRAEALRQAMLAYMNDAANPRNAYPAYWAPFVVVGEGAAR
jgi:CHAT domain-containing protein